MEFRPTLFHCNPIIILPLRRDAGAQHTKRHDHNILYRLLARPCDHTLRRNPGCSTTLSTYDKTTGAEPESSAPDIRLRRIIPSSASSGTSFPMGKISSDTNQDSPPETPAARSYSTSATTKLLPPMKIISSAEASSRARATASATLFTTSPSRPISAAREASSSAGSARMTAACVKM